MNYEKKALIESHKIELAKLQKRIIKTIGVHSFNKRLDMYLRIKSLKHIINRFGV